MKPNNTKPILMVIAVLFLGLTSAFGQWTKRSENDAFDGKTKYATAKGRGAEWPYTNPKIVCRFKEKAQDSDIYLTGIGYSGCDNNVLYIKFSKTGEMYEADVLGSVGDTALFISDVRNESGNSIGLHGLVDLMKKGSIMYVRWRSSCQYKDFTFSLGGSTNALNYVFGDYFQRLQKEVEELEAQIAQMKEELKISFSKTYSTQFTNGRGSIIKGRSKQSLIVEIRGVSKMVTIELSGGFISDVQELELKAGGKSGNLETYEVILIENGLIALTSKDSERFIEMVKANEGEISLDFKATYSTNFQHWTTE